MNKFTNITYRKYVPNEKWYKFFIFTESAEPPTTEFSMLIADGNTENFLSAQKLNRFSQVIDKFSTFFGTTREGKWTRNFLSPSKRDKRIKTLRRNRPHQPNFTLRSLCSNVSLSIYRYVMECCIRYIVTMLACKPTILPKNSSMFLLDLLNDIEIRNRYLDSLYLLIYFQVFIVVCWIVQIISIWKKKKKISNN